MMMSETPTILVQFDAGSGLQRVSRETLESDLAEKSQHAIDSAMDTIKAMADRVQAVMHHVTEPPTQVEVTFGLTLEAEAGALIAKAKTGATIEVSMTWEREH
jgi:hypothetical protein